MIYVVASSERVYRDWCHERDLDPRDHRTVRRIRETRHALGIFPKSGDEYHVIIIEGPVDNETYDVIKEMRRRGFEAKTYRMDH